MPIASNTSTRADGFEGRHQSRDAYSQNRLSPRSDTLVCMLVDVEDGFAGEIDAVCTAIERLVRRSRSQPLVDAVSLVSAARLVLDFDR